MSLLSEKGFSGARDLLGKEWKIDRRRRRRTQLSIVVISVINKHKKVTHPSRSLKSRTKQVETRCHRLATVDDDGES